MSYKTLCWYKLENESFPIGYLHNIILTRPPIIPIGLHQITLVQPLYYECNTPLLSSNVCRNWKQHTTKLKFAELQGFVLSLWTIGIPIYTLV